MSAENYEIAQLQASEGQELTIDTSNLMPSDEDLKKFKTYIKPRLYNLAVMIRDKRPEEEILGFLMLSRTQLGLYKRWFPDLRNAIAQGKLQYVEAAEDALAKCATGMTYIEREIIESFVPDASKPGGFVLTSKKVRTSEKFKPPEMRAIEMVLTNKSPEEWKKTVDGANLTQNNIVNVSVSPEEVRAVMDRVGGFSVIDHDDMGGSSIVVEAEPINE